MWSGDRTLPLPIIYLGVAPETMLLTIDGAVAISTLVGQQVPVWNGTQWIPATILQTGEAQPLLRVTLQDERTLDCTPDHLWYVQNERIIDTVETPTSKLVTGNKLCRLLLPEAVDGEPSDFPVVGSVANHQRIDNVYSLAIEEGFLAVFNGILLGTGQYTAPIPH